MKTTKEPTWVRVYPYLLVIGGFLGLFSAVSLAIDKIKLLENPAFQPVCNLNPILSCTSVISSRFGTTFGISNPFIGLAAFGAVVTVGMAILASAKFKKWFWLGLLAGTFLGVIFIHWLYFQSVYTLGKLCLYCMLVWSVTMPIFWYTLLMNYRLGFLSLPKAGQAVFNFLSRHHLDILIVWYLAIAGSIIAHFWYYFKTW